MKIVFALLFSVLIYRESVAQMALSPSTISSKEPLTNFVKTPGGYIGVKRILLKPVMAWHKERYSLSVVQYDDKMNFLKENKLSDGNAVYSAFVPKLILGHKLWLVYTDPGNKNYLGNMQATEIEISTLKPLDTKMIASEEDLNIRNPNDFYKQFDVRFKNSPDNKYHCVYISNRWNKDFFLACLDNELKALWKGTQRILDASYEDINNVAVENTGEVLITSVDKNKGTISRYDLNGVAVHHPLEFGEAKPQFIDIIESQSGQVYIGGTLQNKKQDVDKVFLAKLGKANSLSALQQIDIPENIIDRVKKDNLAQNSGLVGFLLLPELTEQNDGRIKLVIECKRLIGADRYEAFGALIITDFSVTPEQFFIIPKYSVGSVAEPDRNQYVVRPSKNSIALFYFDNKDNLTKNLDEPQKVLRGTVDAIFVGAIIDNAGVIKRFSIPESNVKTQDELINIFMANNF